MEVAEVADVAAEVVAEAFADVAADIAAGVVGRTELEAWVEIRQPEELEVFNSLRLSVVLLVAVRYWNSLKSYTSFSTQSLVVVGGYL